MKVCVLEWICGGGMKAIPTQEIPRSLRSEGYAMLATLVRAVASSGAEVSTTLDPRLELTVPLGVSESVAVDESGPLVGGLVPFPWVELARQSDFAIVVAPEIDGVLSDVLSVLRKQGGKLLNCEGAFLANTSDKRRTALCLHAAGIAHPPTYELDRCSESLLEHSDAQQWVVKPFDGAGCERLRLLDRDALHSIVSLGQATGMIAQPLLLGNAYSCSAIVDRNGNASWMPLVTQQLTDDFKYCGGSIVAPKGEVNRPTRLLDRAMLALGSGAMGWVGVDLLFDAEHDVWSIIEVNPRATTSLIGLAAASNDLIGRQLCEAFHGSVHSRIDRWRSIQFAAEGAFSQG